MFDSKFSLALTKITLAIECIHRLIENGHWEKEGSRDIVIAETPLNDYMMLLEEARDQLQELLP